MPAAPKPPGDPDADRIKQDRLEKIRKQQAEKKEALLRARALKLNGRGSSGTQSVIEESSTSPTTTSATSAEDKEAVDIISSKGSPRGRAATATASLKRGVSAGSIGRVAGRGKASTVRSPRSVTPASASSVVAPLRISEDSLPSVAKKRLSASPVSSPRSPTGRIARSPRQSRELSARDGLRSSSPQKEVSAQPPPPIKPRTPPPKLPAVELDEDDELIEAAEDIPSDDEYEIEQLRRPAPPPTEPIITDQVNKAAESDGAGGGGGGGGGWGISWGAFSNVTNVVASSIKELAASSPRAEQRPTRSQPPPMSSPRPPESAGGTFLPRRDSLSTLEELLEMQESIDALRLMVAQQGSQLRKQDKMIELLQSRVETLEGSK